MRHAKKNVLSLLILCSTLHALAAEGLGAVSCVAVVTLEPGTKTLLVDATYSNMGEGEYRLSFRDYFVYAGRQKNLSRRVGDLRVNGGSVLLVPGGDAAATVLPGASSLRVSFRFNPARARFDHHLVAWTDSTVHIPLEDLLPDISGTGGSGDEFSDFSVETMRVKVVGLPPSWVSVNPYVELDGYANVGEGRWREMLLSWGDYETVSVPCATGEIVVAIDRAAPVDRKRLLGVMRDYFGAMANSLGPLPSDGGAVAVLNWAPFGFKTGGQAKDGVFIATLGWPDVFDFAGMAELVMHEGFHLWNRDFNLRENVYWFTEGCARYEQKKSALALGLMTQREFDRYFSDLPKKYARIDESLLDASRAAEPTRDEITLQYEKGAVVAYRLDLALQSKGLNLESFHRALLEKYGSGGEKELDNAVLASEIDAVLGSPDFTRETLY